MNKITVLLGCALAVAACGNPQDQIENSIRNGLAAQGNVQEVELTRQDDDHLNGFATVSTANGTTRLNCTAERQGTSTNFQWRCAPTIDDAMLRNLEGTIRESLSAQASVDEVHMERQDADHATGYAILHDGAGNSIRTECSASRTPGGEGAIGWQCAPGEAPADGGGKQSAAPGGK
jgi:hypothetical protein